MVTSCEHLLSVNEAANFSQKFRKKILATVWKRWLRSSMSAYNLVDKQFGYDISINCWEWQQQQQQQHFIHISITEFVKLIE